MPISRRRKLLRYAKGSNWTSTIPSVYSLSSLGLDTPYLISPADFKIASFYKYVEGQRLPRGLQGARSLKDAAIEVLIRNVSEIDDLNDIPKHLTKRLWNTLNKRCVGFLFGRIDAGQQDLSNARSVSFSLSLSFTACPSSKSRLFQDISNC
jgi:hypothetical protein